MRKRIAWIVLGVALFQFGLYLVCYADLNSKFGFMELANAFLFGIAGFTITFNHAYELMNGN